ncbi:Exocyst complex component EXO70B1 [Spatholobus suberectus]|nr:Exocyst complex component EXO70B1 [Spatholobus suberectus]
MAVPGGGLHPITRYMMNYLCAACQSRQALEQVFENCGHPLKEHSKLDNKAPSSSCLSLQMGWIMKLLESNLKAKSKIYKDPALFYVFLMNNSSGSVPLNRLAKSMKEKLKSFNALFEEICREQASWFVFDEQLREEIRISLEKILLPAYGNFVGRFQSIPELGKHADKYIKYGTEDIQARLNDLFQGSGRSTGKRK